MTPYETLALIVAEQQSEIYRLRRELTKWPTRVESESSLRAFRKATIEECARMAESRTKHKDIPAAIRALAHN